MYETLAFTVSLAECGKDIALDLAKFYVTLKLR